MSGSGSEPLDYSALTEAVLRRLAAGVVNVRTASGDSVTYADPAAQFNALRELEKRERVQQGNRGLAANSTSFRMVGRSFNAVEHREIAGRG